jgi:lysophospholipase L1-like esterase
MKVPTQLSGNDGNAKATESARTAYTEVARLAAQELEARERSYVEEERRDVLGANARGACDSGARPSLEQCRSILCFGDSLTEGFCYEAGAKRRRPYSERLASLLKARGLAPGAEIINAGVSGEGTCSMVNRLSELLQARTRSNSHKHFDLAIILGGTNDLACNPRDREGTLCNLCALHEAVHRSGGRTCVVTVPFIRTQKLLQEVDADRCWLNASLREYARRRPSQTVLIDLAASIPQDDAHAALWGPDWVHLSAAGYIAMGDAIGSAVLTLYQLYRSSAAATTTTPPRVGAQAAPGSSATATGVSPPPPTSKAVVGDKLEYNSTTQGGWIECTVVETRPDGAIQVDVKPRHWFTIEELGDDEKFRFKNSFIIMCLPEMHLKQAAPLLDCPTGVRCELEPHESDPSCRGLLLNWDVPSANGQVSHHVVELKRSGLEDNIVACAELAHPHTTAVLSRITPGHCYFVSVVAVGPSGAGGRKWGAIISLPWTVDDAPPAAPRRSPQQLPPHVVQDLLVVDAVPAGQQVTDPSKAMIYVTWSAPCTWAADQDRSVYRHHVAIFNGALPAGGWTENPLYTKILEGTAASFALAGFARGPVYTVAVSIIGPDGEGPPVYASVTLAPLAQDSQAPASPAKPS